MLLRKQASNSIQATVDALRSRKVVIIPTDTVYGFSAIVPWYVNANSSTPLIDDTGNAIRAIKGRSETKPFIELIASPLDYSIYTDTVIPQKILSLWPAPLTVIVKRKKEFAKCSSTDSVALRVPADEWLCKVIKACGVPIYSTSCNLANAPILQKIADIDATFGKDCLIIDDGDKNNALPSTIVDVRGKEIVVVRQGAVSL